MINANIGMRFLLNVSDALNYAGEGSKKFIEGENIVNSNHLMLFGPYLVQSMKISECYSKYR